MANDLQEIRARLVELEETFDRLAESSLQPAVITTVDKTDMTLAVDGKLYVAKKPAKTNIKIGDQVLVTHDSKQYVRHNPQKTLGGDIVTVDAELDAEYVICVIAGQKRPVYRGDVADLKAGDQVMLDMNRVMIARKIEVTSSVHDHEQNVDVPWSAIGGQLKAKQDLQEAIELPFKHPDLFRFYGKKPIKGVLLEGPPGCGKTMLAKAAATSLGKKSGFLYVKGAEILDPYVGVAEANVRALFERARQHQQKTGVPAIIFIDEADALLSTRGSRQTFMENTIVPTFLAEMDGLNESSAIVILATNRADSLDPAITREGRMDRKVYVGRPEKNDATEILNICMKNTPVDKSTSAAAIVQSICDAIYNGSNVLYDVRTDIGVRTFSLAHLISGAMLVNIVDQMLSAALHRDLHAGGKPSGVNMNDALAAVQRIFQQNLNVDHTQALTEFAGNERIINVTKRNFQHVETA